MALASTFILSISTHDDNRLQRFDIFLLQPHGY